MLTSTHVLLCVPCLGQLRILGGVDYMSLGHIEVIRATKGLDWSMLGRG